MRFCKMLFQRGMIILLAAFTGVFSAATRGRGKRGSEPNLPYDPSTTTLCEYWYDNEAGSLTCDDILETFALSLAEFRGMVSVHTLQRFITYKIAKSQ